MLSACWQCLAGNQERNTEGNSTGIRLPVISDNMLFLPKPLQNGDHFTIQGKLRENPRQVSISIIGEEQQPNENVICKVDLELSPSGEDMIISQTADAGLEIVNKYNGSQLLNGDDVIIIFRARDDYTLRIFSSSKSFLAEVPLKTSISDARFISYNGDLQKITNLTFEFA